jgi:hypothetical protein
MLRPWTRRTSRIRRRERRRTQGLRQAHRSDVLRSGVPLDQRTLWGKLRAMMAALVSALVLLALGALLVRALAHHLELARLRVQDGKAELIRGRLPPRLFGDLRDVLGAARATRAQIRIVVEEGRPRVLAEGLDEASAQQLRNVVGAYTVAQIRAGRSRGG